MLGLVCFNRTILFTLFRLDPLKEAMDSDGKIDAAKLEAWIIKSQIDPNDSDNEELMSR